VAAAIAAAAAAASQSSARPHTGILATRRDAGSDSQAEQDAVTEDVWGSLGAQALLFLSYFFLQLGMSLYMKFLLSKVHVASDLIGIPASFLVTSSQQLVGFGAFVLLVLLSRLVGRPYRPKILKSYKEYLLVLALSISFSLNIGLNLLSLSLVPLSLTMIIRACSPLSTALMQSVLMRKKQDIAWREWLCMCVGVVCASAVVVAQSGGVQGGASFAFYFGVAMSVTSLFSGALDFVFKGVLGTGSVKLNALDTTCYMALPVAVFTTALGAVLRKPVSTSWAGHFTPRMTDVEVFRRLWEINPAVFKWVLLSGLLAFMYNTFVTFMIVKLSPATTAFAGNFNKAATILIALLILERGVSGPRGLVVLLAVLGNITAFTFYNVLRKRRNQRQTDSN